MLPLTRVVSLFSKILMKHSSHYTVHGAGCTCESHLSVQLLILCLLLFRWLLLCPFSFLTRLIFLIFYIHLCHLYPMNKINSRNIVSVLIHRKIYISWFLTCHNIWVEMHITVYGAAVENHLDYLCPVISI